MSDRHRRVGVKGRWLLIALLSPSVLLSCDAAGKSCLCGAESGSGGESGESAESEEEVLLV